MAVRKTYGTLVYNKNSKHWVLSDVEPHVLIRIKRMFATVRMNLKTIAFPHKEDIVYDLEWLLQRYPMKMKPSHRKFLYGSAERYRKRSSVAEAIINGDYKAKPLKFKNVKLRDYQEYFVSFAHIVKRTLLGDVVGLGKTFQYLALAKFKNTRPMMCVVQTHLPRQLIKSIELMYPDATYQYFKTGYDAVQPGKDFYIMKYSLIAKYTDKFRHMAIKSVVFDEIQDLRRPESLRYQAAKLISNMTEYCIGASATPIYNYGDEAYSVFDLIKEDCLDTRENFNREWMDFSTRKVKDPKALGMYLREQKLMVRRNRVDVGRELPPINKIVEYVETDQAALTKFNELAKKLAKKSIYGANLERGNARMELDIMLRQATGIAKARGVAQYIRLFLENGEKVLLGVWHREVYKIIEEELREFNPVFYSGSETPKQKDESFLAFTEGNSQLMMMSLRSGAGLDGMQDYCSVVAYAELDWSPKVMEQFTGRIARDRTDGTFNNVTEVYLLSKDGSDPCLVEILGIKSTQSSGIVDPLATHEELNQKQTDETRLERLAKLVLEKNGLISED